MLVASSKVLPDPSGGALLRGWQFKRLSTLPDMRAGWARIDATPVAPGLLPPNGLKIVGGCNALREPLLLAMRRVETYGDSYRNRSAKQNFLFQAQSGKKRVILPW
jgi:hypothetical protein